MNLNPVKCVSCGKFISYNDGSAKVEYTPLSEFTFENIEWTCGLCVKKDKLWEMKRKEKVEVDA